MGAVGNRSLCLAEGWVGVPWVQSQPLEPLPLAEGFGLLGLWVLWGRNPVGEALLGEARADHLVLAEVLEAPAALPVLTSRRVCPT